MGTAQDADYPQSGCLKVCCEAHWKGKIDRQFPVSLGLVNRSSEQAWLFEARPGAKGTPAFTMPRMKTFLTVKDPWS